MSDEEKSPKRKGGCFGKLLGLFVFLGLGGLVVALYFISQPQDLSDLDGVGPSAAGTSSRDLKAVLANSLKGGYPVTLTEEDLNLYLRDTLRARQGGILEDRVGLKQVALRLEKDRVEVVILREIAGHPFTTSMYLRVSQTTDADSMVRTEISRNGGPYHESLPFPMKGGRFGRLAIPEGFLVLVLPGFSELVTVFRDPTAKDPVLEIDFIEEMSRIRIEEGKLVLDPRPPTRETAALGSP